MYCVLSCFCRVQLCGTPWTAACQAPLSMGFSMQEYWSGLLCPPPGDLPDPGIELKSLMSAALTGGFLTTTTTWEAQCSTIPCLIRDVCYRLTEKWIFVVHPILNWAIVNLQCCIVSSIRQNDSVILSCKFSYTIHIYVCVCVYIYIHTHYFLLISLVKWRIIEGKCLLREMFAWCSVASQGVYGSISRL